MKKKLTFSVALLAMALSSMQAAELFSEDWSSYSNGATDRNGNITADNPIDPTKWTVDNGGFGDGIYSSCYGDYDFEAGLGDNALYMKGSNGRDGYWSGFQLLSVPTFSASMDKVLVVEGRRITHAQAVQSGSATRTGMWLINSDKSKWLLYADNFGESNWGFNPYSGTTADYPVNNPANVGYSLSGLNSTFADVLHGDVELKIVANGSSASMYMRDPAAEEPVWVYGNTIALNLGSDIRVGLGVYTRAPETGTDPNIVYGDEVNAQFGPITVSYVNAGYFGVEELGLNLGTISDEITVTTSAEATASGAVTFTVVSGKPEIAIPVGGADGKLDLTFAKGETTKTFQISAVGRGKANFTLTPPEGMLASNELLVTVPVEAGVKISEDFTSDLDPEVWEWSTKGYEYSIYPTADVSYDFWGIRDGQLVMDNMVATVNYWGGRSIITKDTFTADDNTALRVAVDLDHMDKVSGVAVCCNLLLYSAGKANFFALRYNNGEGGWSYNKALGASGTAISAFSGKGGKGLMEIVYNGKTIQIFLDGVYGGSIDWVSKEGLYVELGFYAREAGASGSGAVNSILIENTIPAASVSPSAIQAFPTTKNLFSVTVPAFAVIDGVEIALTSEDPAIAYPEESTLVFEKGGSTTKTVNIVSVTPGKTTIKLTPNVDWLDFVENVAVTSYAASTLLASDDFSGNLSSWTEVSRPANGGTSEGTIITENGELVGYQKCTAPEYPVQVVQWNEVFYPSADSPVVIEYDQGPVGGMGSIIAPVGVLVEPDSGSIIAFGYSRGDIMGWNMYPGYAFATDTRPAAFKANEFLDNGWHKVRMVLDGTYAKVYLDDVYGGAMAWGVDKTVVALGGASYMIGNEIDFVFDNFKVSGTAKIMVNNADIALGDDVQESSFAITIPQIIRDAGVTLNLAISDSNVARFDTGITKEITLNASSAAEQTINVYRVGVGSAKITVTNSGDYLQTADEINVLVSQSGKLLFTDVFNGLDNWNISEIPFEEVGQPDGKGTAEYYATGAGLEIANYSLDVNYWGGWQVYSKDLYKASLMSPLTFEVDREYFSRSGTGVRTSFIIRSADKSKWINISESTDDGTYPGWGYNKVTGDSLDKAEGAATTLSTDARIATNVTDGWRTVRMIANGTTVDIFVGYKDGGDVTQYVYVGTLSFPVKSDIQIGLGVYARQAGDNLQTIFNEVRVYGSEAPLPDPIQITRQPVGNTVMEGEMAAFVVGITGDDPVYAWYKDGTLIEGATSATYTIASATLADAGEYTVLVSNESTPAGVLSDPATLIVKRSVTPIFEDNFSGGLDLENSWYVSTRSFEYAPDKYPNAGGTINYTTGEDGLNLDFVLTSQYWGGWTIYTQDAWTASAENPLTFEVDRTFFEWTGTGDRCSFIISDAKAEKWINFTEMSDNATGYLGWGYNRKIGEAGDNDNGAATVFGSLKGEQFTDMKQHTVKIVADGETATFFVDGIQGDSPISFPVTEGIRFAIGVYSRANGDTVKAGFGGVAVYGQANVEAPELGYGFDAEGKLVLMWPATATLQSANAADAAEWTDEEGKLVGGALSLTVDQTVGTKFYRVVLK